MIFYALFYRAAGGLLLAHPPWPSLSGRRTPFREGPDLLAALAAEKRLIPPPDLPARQEELELAFPRVGRKVDNWAPLAPARHFRNPCRDC